MNDQERIYSANRYNNREKEREFQHMKNPQFRYKETQQRNWFNKQNDEEANKSYNQPEQRRLIKVQQMST